MTHEQSHTLAMLIRTIQDLQNDAGLLEHIPLDPIQLEEIRDMTRNLQDINAHIQTFLPDNY